VNDDAVLLEFAKSLLSTRDGRDRFCSSLLSVLKTPCSNPIRIVLRQLIPYRQYLRLNYWKRISLDAKERAGFRCQLCNSESDLETHHRSYERRGREESSDLTVLCSECHGKFHDEAVSQ